MPHTTRDEHNSEVLLYPLEIVHTRSCRRMSHINEENGREVAVLPPAYVTANMAYSVAHRPNEEERGNGLAVFVVHLQNPPGARTLVVVKKKSCCNLMMNDKQD
ncbi:hypothetical protein EYF80_014954 [Liparis tanakae]|uniref:Uncharacterized protein n=1 Tax=Liparis tanakae TaxID=230148 RepID=A0A4Z2IBY7_9TELE|nr:hypothetical protein EYF80_014954 [Liparis tanakae]